jgi:hypothetical protein
VGGREGGRTDTFQTVLTKIPLLLSFLPPSLL